MPRAKLLIELENPKDYLEILKSGEKFKGSKTSLKVVGNSLSVEIDADDAKSMTSAIGSVLKQMRIIDETLDALKKS